jgi:hypothetical protein
MVNYFIERQIRRTNREKVATNITNAKTVGILFSLENEQFYEQVSLLMDEFADQKKVVNALVYNAEAQTPSFFVPKIKIDVFTHKDLNFVGIPTTGFIKDFIGKKYDILFDLTLADNQSLDYIACLSQAKFKIGRYREKMIKFFDVLISKNEEMSELLYLKYFMDYSSKINTKS